MTLLYAFRYFHVVAVVPPLFLAGFGVAVGAAILSIASQGSMTVDALAPIVMLQLFAAASGFRIAARRGHYDLLLTSGVPRWQVAVTHCVASVAPGLVAWTSVILFDAVTHQGSSGGPTVIGSTLVFLGLSLLAWAVAVPVSRATASVGWLLVLTIPPIARLASPIEWIGLSPVHATWSAVCGAIAVVGVPLATAGTWITRTSVPLEGSQ
jgi:hypothetical protein